MYILEKKGPGKSLEVLVPRDYEGPGTKTSQDLSCPKVLGLEKGKSPGKMETLVTTCTVVNPIPTSYGLNQPI